MIYFSNFSWLFVQLPSVSHDSGQISDEDLQSMMISNEVREALSCGIDPSRIKMAIKKKWRETGSGFSASQHLVRLASNRDQQIMNAKFIWDFEIDWSCLSRAIWTRGSSHGGEHDDALSLREPLTTNGRVDGLPYVTFIRGVIKVGIKCYWRRHEA